MKHSNTNTTALAIEQSNQDFKNAVLIVSVTVNSFILITWMVAQVSSEYAAQLSTLI